MNFRKSHTLHMAIPKQQMRTSKNYFAYKLNIGHLITLLHVFYSSTMCPITSVPFVIGLMAFLGCSDDFSHLHNRNDLIETILRL